MRKLRVENQTFNLKDIERLYPAVLVKTGYGDEVTEMSLEWIDMEAKGRVEVVEYGIFILTKGGKSSFLYKSREELERAIAQIAKQL